MLLQLTISTGTAQTLWGIVHTAHLSRDAERVRGYIIHPTRPYSAEGREFAGFMSNLNKSVVMQTDLLDLQLPDGRMTLTGIHIGRHNIPNDAPEVTVFLRVRPCDDGWCLGADVELLAHGMFADDDPLPLDNGDLVVALTPTTDGLREIEAYRKRDAFFASLPADED